MKRKSKARRHAEGLGSWEFAAFLFGCLIGLPLALHVLGHFVA